MELINLTPFSAAVFRQFDRNGALDGYVAVRAGFGIRPGKRMGELREQPEFLWQDCYEGSPLDSCLMAQADLLPYKPGTDVTYVGNSYAPNGKAKRWRAGIEITGKVSHHVDISGPRQWHPRQQNSWKKLIPGKAALASEIWELSEPEEATMVPIRWTLTSGGYIHGVAKDAANAVDPENTIGVGRIDPKQTPSYKSYPAPSITHTDEKSDKLFLNTKPAGLGPLSPWWQSRQRYAGTYDKAWLDHRHPLLPEDFNPLFWQCAPEPLIAIPWLKGSEKFKLENLHPDYSILTGELPNLRLIARVHIVDCPFQDFELNLDGVHFDFSGIFDCCFLTFRVRFPLDEAAGARVVLRALNTEGERWRERRNPLKGNRSWP